MADNLREYLISLGFDVDSAGQQKMKAAIREGALQAGILFEALKGMAEEFTSVVGKWADQLNDLYITSKIFGASANELKAFEQGLQKVGISADQSKAAYVGFAKALIIPGRSKLAENFAGLSDNEWNKLDQAHKLLALAKGLGRYSPYLQQQFGSYFGLDYETIQKLRLPEAAKDIEDAAESIKKSGADYDKAADDAHKLNNALIDLRDTLENFFTKIGDDWAAPITNGLQKLDTSLKEHGGDIAKVAGDIGDGFKNLDDFLAKLGTPDVQSALAGTVQDIENLATAFKDVSGWLDKIASSPAWKRLTGTLQPAPSGNSGTYDFLYNLDPNLPGILGVNPGSGTTPTPSPQATPPADNRNLWQRYAPSWLGGKPAPGAQESATAGKWWTPDRQAHAVQRLMKEAGLSEQGARALVARWATVESPHGPASVNPISGAFGIEQDLGARKAGIAGDTNFDDQLTHAVQQLNTTESRAARMLRSTNPWTAAIGASQYERAEGYNPATGTDNFTSRVYGAMKNIAIMSPAAAAEALKRFPIGGAAGSLSPYFDTGGLGAFSPANGNVDNSKHSALNQKTTIHVYADTGEEIGGLVAKRQDRLNTNLARQFASLAVG